MKLTTIISDIEKLTAKKLADKAAAAAERELTAATQAQRLARPDYVERVAQLAGLFHDATTAAATKEAAVKRLPEERRTLAQSIRAAAVARATAAAHVGGEYSGETKYSVKWGDCPSATTITSKGYPYAGKFKKFSTTDATHQITLCTAGVVGLHAEPQVCDISATEGLHLIALDTETHAATWVTLKGKALAYSRGFVVWTNARNVIFHADTLDKAWAGLARKVKQHEKEQAEARARWEAGAPARKAERRARLVTRLCAGVVATIEDAKKMGFCSPGIQAFQTRHGIGDSAPLPALVRTGDPMAARLALQIARQVSHN